jgi:hypothetical protein
MLLLPVIHHDIPATQQDIRHTKWLASMTIYSLWFTMTSLQHNKISVTPNDSLLCFTRSSLTLLLCKNLLTWHSAHFPLAMYSCNVKLYKIKSAIPYVFLLKCKLK